MIATTRTVTTKDTHEDIAAAVLLDHHNGDGYEWMDKIGAEGWAAVPNWGSEGWDLGQWPYVMVAATKTADKNGALYGMATYCEGDTTTSWFRSQIAQWEAITEQAFFSWTMGQAPGPADLPATAAGLPDRDRC